MLSNDVILEIFDFYVDEDMDNEDPELYEKETTEAWITLAHVCRRWRSVVFRSPRRLNLRLLCTPLTPTRDTLDIWPPLPLIIRVESEPPRVEDVIAALEHNECVCQIDLIDLTSSQWEDVTDSAAVCRPFPELTHLQLAVLGPKAILPDSFLDGTAPRLRSLYLVDVLFPKLLKLLLSTTHLVDLSLDGIGYIPPEAMAISLSALTSLEYLCLYFRSPRPRPETRRPPPPTRSILPSLTEIRFKGASEYLEVILARIDAPRLDKLDIAFFNQIVFNTPQLFQFISRRPTLSAPEKGYIEFSPRAIIVKFSSQTSDYGVASVHIPCSVSEWQISSLEQVCTSSFPPFSTLEDLHIFEDQLYSLRWQDDVENAVWLDLLRSFVAVKNLYISEDFVPRIAPALQELVGGRTTEVLPNLDNIFLGGFQSPGPLHEGIEKFIIARRLASHPVAVSRWDRERHWDFDDL